MSEFVHLHVHTQYSVLDGASAISDLFKAAQNDGQTALAITDHGNMFGVKEFLKTAKTVNSKAKENNAPGVKPIVGCEVYVARNSRFDKNGKEDQGGRHLILLAKNKTGYYNLVKLVSLGYIEGFYSRPRIDKELLFRYSEGLIVSSACIGGEIPKLLRAGNMAEAERVALEFKEHFGDDFYLELQRHVNSDPKTVGVYEQQKVANAGLIEIARKTGIKLIATNDVHFVKSEDAEAHDRLICLNTNAKVNDENRMHYTKQEWLKTRAEMSSLFADIPEAIANTVEIAAKVEEYSISSNAIMPEFPIPAEFADNDAYLRHLTYKGAEKRYPQLSKETTERIDFELNTINSMGFPGYFLIVQDFITEARKMGVSVGPGRGSAAGSVVAYCLGITDIDPIKYDLLFERFLNPDRISMPDIDIDFDDDGRAKVLKYVEDKYGKGKVAHIITYGTMAAKSSIKDVARVQDLPLEKANSLAKLVPDGAAVTLEKAFNEVPELRDALKSGDEQVRQTLQYALRLEGSVRNTGVHACGIIIGRDDLSNYVPLSIAKDKSTNEDMLVTQYEGKEVEDIGLLKMDFLGLSNLSIIKEALENIRLRHGIEVNLNAIPLDDAKTYTLYSKGETVGTFQFESDGMRKWLKQLKPTKFEDLIAMNALYRPGPMDYIPDFIERKHGRKSITYDLPEQAEYLEDTYGVTVYQEQVMLLSQKLAGFTKGEADSLRKAMGKKDKAVMDKMKAKFITGGKDRGHDLKKLEKIWTDWEAFAQYAFNKSHSTCYSLVAYQTAWLKAHYPSEYMAAVLSRNLSDTKSIAKFMDECRRMGIKVLGPDINESYYKFAVNADGDIRFGLAAIKNVGAAAVESIIDERRKHGAFTNIHSFFERVNLSAVNKRTVESLANAGAFDNLDIKREQFAVENSKNEKFIDVLLRYGNKSQADKLENKGGGLFGDIKIEVSKPEIPAAEAWNRIDMLNMERELTGMFLSSHPLDDYRFEMEKMVTVTTKQLNEDMAHFRGKMFTMGGLVSSARHDVSKNGKPWGSFVLEDYEGTYEFRLFSKDYESFMKFMEKGKFLLVKATVQERPQYGANMNAGIELEVKIRHIALLSNARIDLKHLSIALPAAYVTPAFIDELSDIIEKCSRSEHKVEFRIKLTTQTDDSDKPDVGSLETLTDELSGEQDVISEQTDNKPVVPVEVELFSRKFRVGIDDELIDFLKDNGLNYAVG
jgi:DNA polymerase-3 subunit alpha